MTTHIAHDPESFDLAFDQSRRVELSLDGIERQMFEGAREYIWVEQGIDIYQATPDQAHAITDGLHTYVSTISNNKIDDLNGNPRVSRTERTDPDSAIQDWTARETKRILSQGRKATTSNGQVIFSVPRDTITKRIGDHYAKFYPHRHKDTVVRQLEEQHLQHGLRYITRANETLRPNQTVQRRKTEYVLRSYPEVSIALRLEEIFRELELTTAADSALVLNWAYGNRFQELTTKLGEVTQWPSRVQSVVLAPEDELPDKPMRPRRRD